MSNKFGTLPDVEREGNVGASLASVILATHDALGITPVPVSQSTELPPAFPNGQLRHQSFATGRRGGQQGNSGRGMGRGQGGGGSVRTKQNDPSSGWKIQKPPTTVFM